MSDFCEDAERFLSNSRVCRPKMRTRTLHVDASLNYKLLGYYPNEKMMGMRLVRTNKSPVDWKYLEQHLRSISIASDSLDEIPLKVLYLDEQLFGTNTYSIDLVRWMAQNPIVIDSFLYKRLPLLNPTDHARQTFVDKLEGYHVEFDLVEIPTTQVKPGHESFVYCPQLFTSTTSSPILHMVPKFDGGVHELWISLTTNTSSPPLAKNIQIKVANQTYFNASSDSLEKYRSQYTSIQGYPVHFYSIPFIPNKKCTVYPLWDGSGSQVFNMSADNVEVFIDLEEGHTYDVEMRVNSLNVIRMMEGMLGYGFFIASHMPPTRPQDPAFTYYKFPLEPNVPFGL